MSTTKSTSLDASFRGSRGFSSDIDRDLLSGIRAWPMWTMLGWNDIRQRYRRSVLGPFWITLSVAVFISLLGVIYSNIFKIELRTYLPFLTLGYVIWGFVAQATGESSLSFQESAHIIRQIRLPYSIFAFRVVWRNFIVFLHTIVVFIPIAIFYDVRPGFVGFLALPGLALVYVNQAWVTLALAIVCTRYRDVHQIVNTGIQIMLFTTPIMWPVSALGSAAFIAYVNPLYHLLELVRAPMLGEVPSVASWLVAFGFAVLGWTIAILLLRRATYRLVFWL